MRTLLRISPFLLLALLASPAIWPEEYFGEFLDKLKGTFVNAQPRPLFKLESEFRFKDPNGLLWSTPSGTEVDGASIPQSFWSFIGGPFEGAYINASVIHDYYCNTRQRTAHDTHRVFYYGMRAANVPEWKATLMYWAVATFGPQWQLEKQVLMKQKCTSNPLGVTTCITTPEVANVLVSEPSIDLGNPVVLAAAVSKANAVARTLLTSEGKVLDVTSAGTINATADAIEANAAAYRKVFQAEDFTTSPAKLGLLSQPTGDTLADVKPWENNRIPTLAHALVLSPQTVTRVEAGAPFKLEPKSKPLLPDRVDLDVLRATTTVKPPL